MTSAGPKNPPGSMEVMGDTRDGSSGMGGVQGRREVWPGNCERGGLDVGNVIECLCVCVCVCVCVHEGDVNIQHMQLVIL